MIVDCRIKKIKNDAGFCVYLFLKMLKGFLSCIRLISSVYRFDIEWNEKSRVFGCYSLESDVFIWIDWKTQLGIDSRNKFGRANIGWQHKSEEMIRLICFVFVEACEE